MIARLPSSGETFHRIDALIQAGLRLARSAPSGRILLARIADSIDLAWIPRPWGGGIVAELEAAHAAAREEIAFREIEQILSRAWGTKRSDELDELDPAPVAGTPSS